MADQEFVWDRLPISNDLKLKITEAHKMVQEGKFTSIEEAILSIKHDIIQPPDSGEGDVKEIS